MTTVFSTALRTSARYVTRFVHGRSGGASRSTLLSRRSLCDNPSQPKEMIKVTNFDRTTLVKAKIYKTAEEVPDYVTPTQMRRGRDYMRIRVSLWMIAATVCGCIVMIWNGRYMRDSGDSLQKRALDEQASLRAQGLREAKIRAAQESASS